MKTKFVKAFAVMAIVLLVALTLTACRVTTKSIAVNGAKQVYAGEFDLADYSIVVATSDGNMRTEPLTAQNLANVTVEQLQKAGVYNISVVYDGVTTAFTLTVANRTFEGITFADKTVTYNGTAQSIEVANLPQGATVTYSPFNTYTNAGMYPVTATVSAPDFDTITLSATLTIDKATYDMSQVVFADKFVTYDGTTHSLEATNLPDGVSVAYIGNNQTNVGKYNVVAIFSGDSVNYNSIANKTATLTIVQSAAQGITFADAVITYDGTAHSLAVIGDLPQGIAVIYENNNQTNAGVYTVTAKFVGTNPNYEQLPDMTATLTINKRDLTIEFVGETTIVYDGNAHKSLAARAIGLCGNDTVDVNISYSGDVVEAGTYTAIATMDDVNYQLTGNNTCTLTITRATHKVTFRQSGQPDKVYDVLDLADFAEAFPDVVPVANYDVVWEQCNLTRITQDVVVNAVIMPTVYRITYVLDGGTNPDDAPSRYTIETPTFALPVPQRDYHAFEGWYTEDSFVNKIEQISQGSAGNVTLYAKWQRTSTEGLRYEQLQDGSYAVSGYDGDSGEVLIPLTWKGQPVTTIGDSAFNGCTGLTSITIPDSVTGIGSGAFYGCSGLTSITIPDGVTSIGDEAFYYCTGLTVITIPDIVTSIGKDAFSGCSGLTSIVVKEGNSKYIAKDNCLIDKSTATLVLGCKTSVIPNDGSVTSIGVGAFQGCTGLTSITIPDSVTSIGIRAFYDCTDLTKVTIGNGVTSIGNGAFYGCAGLTNIEIPDGVTSIGAGAFQDCTDLTKVTIGNGVTSIGDWAFKDCTGLTKVTIGNGVTSIGNLAFGNCIGLTSVTIPDSVIYVGSYAFLGCNLLVYNNYDNAYYLGNATNKYVALVKASSTSITSCIINDNCKVVVESAFSYCDGLTSIVVKEGNSKYIAQNNCLIDTLTATLVLGCKTSVIPTDGSVTSIGSYAFYGCTGLKNITIPDSVTSIGDYAFMDCTGLTSVTIPDSVTSIGERTFQGCRGLKRINFNGTKAQWNVIKKYDNWSYNTGNFTVYCTNGTISK